MRQISIRTLLLVLALAGPLGCQSVSGFPTAASPCSLDQVWDTAIASLEGAPLQSADKQRGIVETAWIEQPSRTRAGVLQRDVNKERLKYIIEVRSNGQGATATVQQLREAWTPMGVRMQQWRAMPADEAEQQALTAEISRRLREKGC